MENRQNETVVTKSKSLANLNTFLYPKYVYWSKTHENMNDTKLFVLGKYIQNGNIWWNYAENIDNQSKR